MSSLPRFPAGLATQQALFDAGIPAAITQGRSGPFIQMLPGATPDQVQAALDLTTAGPPAIPPPSFSQVELTDKWLTVKACFEALPPVPGVGPDPHEAARARLAAEVQSALDALTDAGGPG